jgi:hypothetical protein
VPIPGKYSKKNPINSTAGEEQAIIRNLIGKSTQIQKRIGFSYPFSLYFLRFPCKFRRDCGKADEREGKLRFRVYRK